MKVLMHKPYSHPTKTATTEILTFDTCIIDNVAGGMGSRFIDINHEAVTPSVAPTGDQIFFIGSTISNCKSDDSGGFARVDNEYFYMSIESTTFTNIEAGAIGGVSVYGGVFNIIALKKITLIGVTATDIYCPDTPTFPGNGRFLYY
jgi:hypothetical protein